MAEKYEGRVAVVTGTHLAPATTRKAKLIRSKQVARAASVSVLWNHLYHRVARLLYLIGKANKAVQQQRVLGRGEPRSFCLTSVNKLEYN